MTKCPRCGASNRAQAQFCQNCRAPLPSASGKTCPNCLTPNRTDAKFCANCRHQFPASGFTLPEIPIRGVRVPLLLIVISALIVLGVCAIMLVLVLPSGRDAATRVQATFTPVVITVIPTLPPISVAPTRAPTTAATLTSADALDRAKRGTVIILAPSSPNSTRGSMGSGSVITKRGHILTNNHVIQGARGDILIGFPPRDNLKGRVDYHYRAQVMSVDAQLDLALLRIFATSDGGPLPADLGLPPLALGDSDAVDSPDPVTILGYPALGDRTLTVTTGTIAGFSSDGNLIKTDAEINPGNSGGPALNRQYQQIGVASMITFAQDTPGKIGWIRPIKSAKPLIDIAKREAGE